MEIAIEQFPQEPPFNATIFVYSDEDYKKIKNTKNAQEYSEINAHDIDNIRLNIDKNEE